MAAASSDGGRTKASRSHGERREDTDSSRPGTTATPRRSAAWANAEESASPGSRAQIVSPPAGGVHVHEGSSDESADAMAAYRSPLQSARYLTISSCRSRTSAATMAC